MIETSGSIHVDAPPEAVFAFMNQPANQGDVTPSLVDSEEIGRMPNGGAQARYTYKMAGMKFEGEVEAIEWVENERLVFRMTGAIDGKISQSFLPEDGGTRVTYAATYEMPMPALARLAKPLLERYNQREIDGLLHNLKDRVEAEAA